MPTPDTNTMWQELRLLRARVCELEVQLACFPPCNEQPIDVWIDADDVPVIDGLDDQMILYQ